MSHNPWHAPTRVGALVSWMSRCGATHRWGIVIEDGKGYRSNQVRVKWLTDAPSSYNRYWTYIMDLTFVTLPGDAKEPRA